MYILKSIIRKIRTKYNLMRLFYSLGNMSYYNIGIHYPILVNLNQEVLLEEA